MAGPRHLARPETLIDPALIDAAGVAHAPAPTARIASLVPSITETLFALDLGASVVARTGYCIHPAARVEAVPKIGGTKHVNLDKLKRLRPTHAIVNIDENTRDDVDALRAFVPNVVVTHPTAPRDNVALFRLLGALFERRAAALALEHGFESELAAVRDHVWAEERVLALIWKDPWMTVARDTYVSATLAIVGWLTFPAIDGGASGAARYPRVPLDPDTLRGVERVLLTTEPYAFDRAHASAIERATGLPVAVIDGEAVSWYGSRAIEGLRTLAAARTATSGTALSLPPAGAH